jgi:hypothetical protein
MSAAALSRGRVPGNREVSRSAILRTRGHLRAACAEANPEKEGGSGGKHGFPRGNEPKASDG